MPIVGHREGQTRFQVQLQFHKGEEKYFFQTAPSLSLPGLTASCRINLQLVNFQKRQHTIF